VKDIFEKYIASISNKFANEDTSEMGYRTEFEVLLKGIFESINVQPIGHDDKAKGGNKPDFAVKKNGIPILYIEAKDIGVSLDKVEKSEQMKRYFGYANLVLTDYTEFRFYRNGLQYEQPIKIAEYDLKIRRISALPENFVHVAKSLLDFAQSHKEPIKSGKHLSKIMGGKAQRIRDNVKQFLATKSDKNIELVRVYEAIKKLLVHDLTHESFADMYAQTLVYGLFVARYHDKTPKDFSRAEARDLVPKSNPLLQHFFDHIVGPHFDDRLKYIVDELCVVFSHANVEDLMKEYFKDDLWGKTHKDPDPVIHFYEDFLKEYDDALRKKMGAYYTPLPVVQFIVRSVDYLLENEFGLAAGLADTSKTEDGIHRVQILDPAVGTGTFFSDVVGKIYTRIKKTKQEGRWPTYVHHDLLPRLHGFEIMMTPYTIAHLKMAMAFEKTGFKYFNQRLGIYLTNALDQSDKQEDLLSFGFAESIAEESKKASVIKNETPIMVVVGNPPYSVSSSNKGDWIQNLIKVYKQDLNEKKINLDDDYIKFIRFAEHFIEKNENGIIAMITNNSFIDGITHRQMRKHLLETFDDIYILDLHGNSKKKEKSPDGGKDENVFDIQQGVSINIFVKKDKDKKALATVHHSELYGNRVTKFEFLNENDLDTIKWKTLSYSAPNYFFIPVNNDAINEYNNGFKIDNLMSLYNSGIQTKRDSFTIHFTKTELQNVIEDLENKLGVEEIRSKYGLAKDGRDWSIQWAKDDLLKGYEIVDILYRPFDVRKTVYSDRSKGFLAYPRQKTSRNFIGKKNLGLLTVRQQSTFPFQHILVSDKIVESGMISLQTKEWGYQFPLYIYLNDGTKIPNLEKEIWQKFDVVVGKTEPEDILDYIYAVLHSPKYREKYKEFLKIDFPRIPYPEDKEKFQSLVAFGKELRELHLLESPKVNQYITSYPVTGSNEVEKITYKNDRVFINDEQYFGDVPKIAWNFYIGGYQPMQKWLKDRKGRALTNEDIEHYQKVIIALVETDRIMKEIDKII